jgi:hypothetical protein
VKSTVEGVTAVKLKTPQKETLVDPRPSSLNVKIRIINVWTDVLLDRSSFFGRNTQTKTKIKIKKKRVSKNAWKAVDLDKTMGTNRSEDKENASQGSVGNYVPFLSHFFHTRKNGEFVLHKKAFFIFIKPTEVRQQVLTASRVTPGITKWHPVAPRFFFFFFFFFIYIFFLRNHKKVACIPGIVLRQITLSHITSPHFRPHLKLWLLNTAFFFFALTREKVTWQNV